MSPQCLVRRGLNSPFTVWESDNVHSRRPVLTGVRVRLDHLFARVPGAPRHVIETGLDLTGEAKGLARMSTSTAVHDQAQKIARKQVQDLIVKRYVAQPEEDGLSALAEQVSEQLTA